MMIIRYFLYFLSGILTDMGLVHLYNFAETSHHPIFARSKTPRLASTLWGLGYVFFAGLILLLQGYRFELSLATVFIFLGFSAWAIFLAVLAEKRRK